MATENPIGYVRDGDSCAVIHVSDHMPCITYVGTDLGTPGEFGELPLDTRIFSRGIMGGGLDHEVQCGIVPEQVRGWMGRPGVIARRLDGELLPIAFEFQVGAGGGDATEASAFLVDDANEVALNISVKMESSGVISLQATLTNDADTPLYLDALRLAFPVSSHATEVLTLGGRHAMEAVQQRTPWGRSVITVENRTGRTSHENLGTVFVGSHGFSEQHGDVWGVHIAWSGNFEITCDGVSHAMRTIHVGELLQPGDVVLQSGEKYTTPRVLVAHSSRGLNHVSRKFHREARRVRPNVVNRPVVLNTWEAVYFNHDLAVLKELATSAARVGVERFVLDDGWFQNRRSDTAGLGDWWVDESVWPNGLTPIIEHVRALGMDFGLWFEPEMVNPDSDLFRSHPDWAIGGQAQSLVTGRHQLVLDLSQQDVCDYLFSRISSMLQTHDISYVKWDHNRPLVGGNGHEQTRGAYELFRRLTSAFPHVQFESCASGGGRIDLGIAEFVDRFWASDSIDALDRLEIQQGLSTFVPPEMLGSHIGSPVCHTTGRKHSLSFRASTAMFGWLGIEWNLLTLTERERESLSEWVGLYKVFRNLIHSGNVFRGDHPDPTMYVHGVISHDATEALLSVSRLRSGPSNHTARVTMQGLSSSDSYDIQLIPIGRPRYALHRALPDWLQGGIVLTGTQIAQLGLEMPALLPESTLLFHITKVTS